MTLRVRMEVVPWGDENKTYEIGRLDIFNKANVGSGYYVYGVIEQDKELNTGGLYEEEILHKRDLGAWALVLKTLDRLVVNNKEERKNMTNVISATPTEGNDATSLGATPVAVVKAVNADDAFAIPADLKRELVQPDALIAEGAPAEEHTVH